MKALQKPPFHWISFFGLHSKQQKYGGSYINHSISLPSISSSHLLPFKFNLQNMGLRGESSGSFSTGQTAQEKGLNYVPNAYVIPTPQRPSLSPETAIVPIIDMASLRSNDSAERSLAIEALRKACISLGFFQVKFQFFTLILETGEIYISYLLTSICFSSDNQSWNQQNGDGGSTKPSQGVL